MLVVEAGAVVPPPPPLTLGLTYERTGPESVGPGRAAQSFAFPRAGEPEKFVFNLDLPPLPADKVRVVPDLSGRIVPYPGPDGGLSLEVSIRQRLSREPTGGGKAKACENVLVKTIKIQPGETVRLDLPPFRNCGPGFENEWWASAEDRLYIAWASPASSTPEGAR